MVRVLDWRRAQVGLDGVDLEGEYIWRPLLHVHMRAPFRNVSVFHYRLNIPEPEVAALADNTLVGIYRTCLQVLEHREELRARYRPVLEAGQHSDSHVSWERYFRAERALQAHSELTPEEREQLLEPYGKRVSAYTELRSSTLQRALDDLGFGWEYAFQVLDELEPTFEVPRA